MPIWYISADIYYIPSIQNLLTNYVIFEGGGNQKFMEDYKGGGDLRPTKMDYSIVECSLKFKTSDFCEISKFDFFYQ